MTGNLKGQSAVEYLITYGWAILILIIVIGAIFASGVLTPSYFISEECYLGPNLPCNFQIYTEGSKTTMLLNVSNGFPYSITLNKIAILSQDGQELDQSQGILESGQSKLFTFDKLTQAAPNSMSKYNVMISYVPCPIEFQNEKKECPSENKHEITGRIIGRVLEKK